MAEVGFSLKEDYDVLYSEASQILEKFSKMESKKISNSFLNNCFLIGDSTMQIHKRLGDFSKSDNISILNILWFNLKHLFTISGILKLLFVATKYLQIYLIDKLTDLLKHLETNSIHQNETKLNCIFLIFIFLIMILVNHLSENRFKRYINCAENRMMVILQIILYKKLLRSKVNKYANEAEEVNQESLNNIKIDDDNGEVNLINLISSDIETSKKFLKSFHELWSSIVSIIIFLVMIALKLKTAFLFGVGILIFLFLINFILNILMMKYIEIIYGVRDRRIGLTTDVIQGIRSIKFLSWENIFYNRINSIRSKELKNLKIHKFLDTLVAVFLDIFPHILLFAFLSWHFTQGNSLQNINIFTIIGLVRSLTFPIVELSWNSGNLFEARIAFKRISKFLLYEQTSENKVLIGGTNSPNAIEIKGIKLSWPKERIFELLKEPLNTENEAVTKKQKSDTNYNLFENESKQHYNEFQLVIEDLYIKRGELYFVLGKIGSGKTAFLKSILDEMSVEPIPGFFDSSKNPEQENDNKWARCEMKVNGTMAYVSQNNWLQDATIKDNILLGAPLDHIWYQKCLELCDLVTDLGSIPQGDEFVVGTNGSKLSGGQRQRLALCRAVYQNADIYLFDDAFSSLDVHVSEKIFRNLISQKLLPMGKTIIFATNTHKFLNKNSKIICINKNHKVITSSIEDQIDGIKIKSLIDNFDEKSSFSHTEIEKTNNKIFAEKEIPLINSKNNEEERDEGDISSKTILLYLKSFGFIISSSFITIKLAEQTLRSLTDYWLKSKITAGDTSFQSLNLISSDFSNSFGFLTGLIILFSILNNICYYICQMSSAKNIFAKLMNSVIFAKMEFFDKNECGSILNRLSRDTYSVDDQLSLIIQVFFYYLISLLNYALMVIILFPWMLIGFLMTLLIMYFTQKNYRSISRELNRLSAINDSKLLNHYNETLTGIETIRAFRKESYFFDSFLEILNESIKSKNTRNLMTWWADIRLSLSSFSMVFLLSLILITFLLIESNVNYSDWGMVLIFSFLFNQDLNATFFYFIGVEREAISLERISHYLDIPVEKLQENPNNMQNIQIRCGEENYEVVFDKVFLSYKRCEDMEDPNFALKNISFSLKKGEKVAFCGRTGSGKSSILNALFKFYETNSGDIRFAGRHINQINLQELRSRIATIPQFGFIFKATLRENLDPEGTFSDEYLNNIIESSGLNLKEKLKTVENTPLLDFLVSDSGENLSQGEKQIVNFLRVLIRNESFLCLDEATSNIDISTDNDLHEALFKYAENKALLVITHRLEHLHRYDRVFVMERGEIVEQGHISELLNNRTSFFNTCFEKKNV